jgi:hypothetical protein
MAGHDTTMPVRWPPVHVLVGEGAAMEPRPAAEALARTGPFLRGLHSEWSAAAAAAGDVPDRAALTPERLRPWLGSVSVYHETAGGDFLIRLDGTRIVAWTGEDWTNRHLSDLDARYGRDLLGSCRGAWHARCPAFGLPVVLFQSETKVMHRLILPVLSADRARRQILLAMWPADDPRRQ